MNRPKSNAAPRQASRKPVARSHKSVGKRDAIVRAATEVINAKSYALATMTEIAAALDLRDATLYYYFPDKCALAYACHRRSLERFEQLLHKVDRSEGKGGEKLKRFIHDMLEDSARNGPQLYFGDYSYLEAAQRKLIETWAARLTGILMKFLVVGMADGSVAKCEPELVVQLLLGMLIWLAKWTGDIEGLTVSRLMDAIDVFSFQGLETRPLPTNKKRI